MFAKTRDLTLGTAEVPNTSILEYTVAINDSLVLPVLRTACSGVELLIVVVTLTCSPIVLELVNGFVTITKKLFMTVEDVFDVDDPPTNCSSVDDVRTADSPKVNCTDENVLL